jgi:cell wall-associated NlpC family hydrolase
MYLNEVVSLYHVFRSAALAASTAVVVAAAPSVVSVSMAVTPELEHLVAQLSPPMSDSDLSDIADVIRSRSTKRKTTKRSTANRTPTTVRRPSRYARSSRSVHRSAPTGVAARSAPASAAPPSAVMASFATGTERGSTALRFAYAQIGKSYRYSASGPNSYDCSGLTMAAWKAAGVSLPHSAAAQYQQVQRVDRTTLLPGDLIFYYRGVSHVGVYAGSGMVIDAPKAGKPVSLRKLDIMPVVGYGRPM